MEEKSELSEKEQEKIKIQQALYELEAVGDCFSKDNAKIVREYIEKIEDENDILKVKVRVAESMINKEV